MGEKKEKKEKKPKDRAVKRKREEVEEDSVADAEPSTTAEESNAGTDTGSLLSSGQVGRFLRNRANPQKPVTNEELRMYIKAECQVSVISKAALKATLKQTVAARMAKKKANPNEKKPVNLPDDFKRGDWVCPGCNNHNFASRTECNKCGLKQPEKEGGGNKPGVKKEKEKLEKWVCPKCENRNFATRKKCNRCEEPKPVEASKKTTGKQEEQVSSQKQKNSIWDQQMLLTREQIDNYINIRDYSGGPLTGEELRNHMVWDLKMDQASTMNKNLFASTLRAALETARKHHKRLKRGRV